MYITKLINADLIEFERRESVRQLITCPKLSKTKFFSDDDSHGIVFAYLQKRTFVCIAVHCIKFVSRTTVTREYVHVMTTETCTYGHTLECV
jgi:hypothetical protein